MIRLTNLRKAFGSTIAVDGLSLDIARGEVFGLLGPNGAGKSTTIGMAVGLLAPDSGSVAIGADGSGGPPTAPPVRARIGVAPQALALYDDHSGRENVEFFGRLYGLSGRGLRTRVDAVLDQVGLLDRAGDRAGGYSGGMKRRLNLAVALVHEPEVLLLDEPTAGVDPQSRNSILELVQALARGGAGTTIVYTTHYMEEAAKLCDRVGIVDHGKLLALGKVDALTRAHGGKSVVHIRRGEAEERLESDDPSRDLVAAIANALPGAPPVAEVRIERPDLESVFLNLTGRRLRD